MKKSTTEIKVGDVLVIDNELLKVIKQPSDVKPGKGPAYRQLEMKNIMSGVKIHQRINSSSTVDRAILEENEYQYLYRERDACIFMDTQTFEQMEVAVDNLSDKIAYLSDGMVVKLLMYESIVVDLVLPMNITVTIISTEPVIKGAAINPSYKPAQTNLGITVMVPHYIKNDEQIVIKTEDGSFVKRVK